MKHHHHEPVQDTSIHKIKTAFFINLSFAVIELIGGLYTNSVAILSDALHDIGDSLSLGTAWYFQKLSRKGRTRKFSYGYRRFSLLGAIINSLVLVVGSTIILFEAIPRLFHPEMPHAEGMIYMAIGGIVANGLAAYKLHGGHSLNEKAVYLHLLEDVLGWVTTLIAAIVMYYKAIPIIDPVLAMGIAAFILFNVFRNLKQALKIILQGTPEDIDPEMVISKLKAIPEIKSTHDCHIWSLDGQYHILSIHAVVDNHSIAELSAMKARAKSLLRDQQIDHITIEFEIEGEHCDPCEDQDFVGH